MSMRSLWPSRPRLECRARRGMCFLMEGLEPRVLLYAALGDQWTYDSRITYSFMPDGTSVGGMPSVLFQTLNARFPTATWEKQIESAASLWENVTGVNFAMVSDGGQTDGASGDQQGDPRFGDVRIGMVPLGSSVLAVTFLPPPANGGTDAGDMLLNSNVNWQIGSNYDLMTVVAHEFGHALGLGESSVSNAVMYGTYNGIKQALATDDVSGVQSIYGTRQFDQFNTGGTRNVAYQSATNINSFMKNSQVAMSGLDITTGGDSEWFYVNAPASASGTMTVTTQSSNLSLLSPKVQVYNSSLSLLAQGGTTASMSATVSVSTSAQAGQGYYIKVLSAGGPGAIGSYGLLVNFASGPQAAIAPPKTMVAQQPDGAGGTSNDNAPTSPDNLLSILDDVFVTIGNLSGWADEYALPTTLAGAEAVVVVTQATSTADEIEVVMILSAGSIASTQSSVVSLLNGIAPGVALPSGAGAGPSTTIFQAIDRSIDDEDLIGGLLANL